MQLSGQVEGGAAEDCKEGEALPLRPVPEAQSETYQGACSMVLPTLRVMDETELGA